MTPSLVYYLDRVQICSKYFSLFLNIITERIFCYSHKVFIQPYCPITTYLPSDSQSRNPTCVIWLLSWRAVSKTDLYWSFVLQEHFIFLNYSVIPQINYGRKWPYRWTVSWYFMKFNSLIWILWNHLRVYSIDPLFLSSYGQQFSYSRVPIPTRYYHLRSSVEIDYWQTAIEFYLGREKQFRISLPYILFHTFRLILTKVCISQYVEVVYIVYLQERDTHSLSSKFHGEISCVVLLWVDISSECA